MVPPRGSFQLSLFDVSEGLFSIIFFGSPQGALFNYLFLVLPGGSFQLSLFLYFRGARFNYIFLVPPGGSFQLSLYGTSEGPFSIISFWFSEGLFSIFLFGPSEGMAVFGHDTTGLAMLDPLWLVSRGVSRLACWAAGILFICLYRSTV